MKPVKQLFRHKPSEGVYGDCHRAALASILELPIEDVPNFCDPTVFREEDWVEEQRKWLFSIGCVPISLFYETEDLQAVLFSTGFLNPNTYGILGGTSANGVGHSVVICNGEIVHDPSQDNSGIVGPMKDGRFWITWFGHVRAARNELAAA